MSDIHDSEISDPTDHETNHETDHEINHIRTVVINVEDVSVEGEPVKKDTSPSSINSDLVDHIAAPTSTVDDSHSSSSSSIFKSTTIIDVDGGGTSNTAEETVKRNYKKLLQNICLGVVITILCGIFLTPIILFYTRPNIGNPFRNSTEWSSCQNVSYIHIVRHMIYN